VLRKGNVINAGEINIPYAVFVVYGLLLWQTFIDGLMLPLNVMQRSKTLLTQVKIPPEALIGSVILKVIFNSFFRITAMLALSLFMNAFSFFGFIKFLVLFPTMIMVGISFGFFLAPFNVIYNDISNIVRISIRPLLYASPILYAIPPVSFLVYLNKINIIGIVLSNLRMLATQNLFYDLQAFGISFSLTLVIFLTGWFIFHLSIPILSDRL
jgi:lipopolysaccharide transport system permease protein